MRILLDLWTFIFVWVNMEIFCLVPKTWLWKRISYELQEIIRHPNYSHVRKLNDIALIRVAKRIKFGYLIQPACLQTDLNDKEITEKLIVMGLEGERMKAWSPIEVTTMPLSKCNSTSLSYDQRANVSAFHDGISRSQYCVFGSDHSTFGYGLNGGALLYVPISDTAEVIGVVSYSFAFCSNEYPSIFTRIASFIEWIEPIVWPNGNSSHPI